MKRSLLQWLIAPCCGQSLELGVNRQVGQEIEAGQLTCLACGWGYPICRGIPRMVRRAHDPALQASFSFEWLHVEATDPDEDVVTFFRRTGLDPRLYPLLAAQDGRKEYTYPTASELGYQPDGSSLRGKRVLDAGCGLGRYVRVVQPYAEIVIGVDVSDAVDRAQTEVGMWPNVHIVQADLFALPFRPEAFDFVYSIGVLPFVPAPQRLFTAMAAACRPGGTVAASVYGREFWLDPVRGTILKALRLVTTRLPHAWLWWWCRRVGYPLGRVQRWAVRRRWTKWLWSPLFLVTIPRHRKPGVMIGDTFDLYAPRRVAVHTAAEVRGWYEAAGCGKIRSLPVATGLSFSGMKAAREALELMAS